MKEGIIMLNKNNKTIAIFSGYHLPHLGGIERYTDNLNKQLEKKGYNVIIVSSNYTFDDNFYEEKENSLYLRLPIYKLFHSRYPLMKKNRK